MNSSERWIVHVARPAERVVARAPRPEEQRLRAALRGMEEDPFGGDVVRLHHERAAFRRRIGDWRILFDVDPEQRLVDVREILRRTTTTYRHR